MKIFFLWGLFLISSSMMWSQSTYKINVSGTCDMCKDRIELTAKNTIGIAEAEYDLQSQILTISVDTLLYSENELHKNLANAGHDTDKVKASKESYLALPTCCYYRDDTEVTNSGSLKKLQGIVYEKDANGKKTAIFGASIYWLNTDLGTASRSDGSFELPYADGQKTLVISYMGYDSDTIFVSSEGALEIALSQGVSLNEVLIKGRKRTMEVSYVSPIKIRKISQLELTKAACCTLSESFDTNPAVDVSYTDAVTGTRQIEMLGLSGPYVQITRENMPDIRGLAAIYGLGYIPGPWIKGIQMTLGTGSVINGFEAIAGQINVELRKPFDKEKFYLNGYYGSGGRYESNLVVNTKVSDRFDTNLLLHHDVRNQAHDNNYDGFLDNPKGYSYSIGNNWKYFGDAGNEAEFGIKITKSDNTSGQDIKHHEGLHPAGYKLWQAKIASNRYEAWMKRGKVFLSKENTSIGLQLGGILYDNASAFGSSIYTGDQKMIYANLIYQTIIKNKDNKISIGTSYQAEITNEKVQNYSFGRKEHVKGIFAEYTFSRFEKLDLVFGIRGDHHNNFGFFATPRFHGRYALSNATVVRAAFGRGQRTANIIAENIGGLVSARKIIIDGSASNTPYGLNAEVAWNYGVNLTHDFNENVALNIDIHATNFQNQIIADYDNNPQEINFYNLKGKSFSRSYQSQLDATLFDNLDLRIAYRYNDVQVDYKEGRNQRLLMSPHRAFANLAYGVKKFGLKFDYTINWQSAKRLADTQSNPELYRLPSYSTNYFLHNVQLTKIFGKKYELYFGGENIFNFKVSNPIVSASDPYGKYFDASQAWGPVFGAMWYGGFRYTIDKKD